MELVWLEWEVVQQSVPRVEENWGYWDRGENVQHLTPRTD
jgi:hypothetical protein